MMTHLRPKTFMFLFVIRETLTSWKYCQISKLKTKWFFLFSYFCLVSKANNLLCLPFASFSFSTFYDCFSKNIVLFFVWLDLVSSKAQCFYCELVHVQCSMAIVRFVCSFQNVYMRFSGLHENVDKQRPTNILHGLWKETREKNVRKYFASEFSF